VFLAVVTALSLAADLGTKQWAKLHFSGLRPPSAQKATIVDGLWDWLSVTLIYARNKGGAWGLLQHETESLRRPFFLAVSVGAIVFIVSLYRKLTAGQQALKWGLPLVLGGALGNLIDRINYGYVIDFIDVSVKSAGVSKHWPTFNVADIAICVGVGLMAIDMFTSRTPRRARATDQPVGLPSEASAETQDARPGPAPLPPPDQTDRGEAEGA
jgi:signal peptidase II